MDKNLEEFLSSHPYSQTTIRTYAYILSRLLEEQNPQGMSAADLTAFVRKPEWGNSRQRVALAASQKYIGWKYGHSHPALTAKIKRIEAKPQRALTESQAMELLASFDTSNPTGARDLAICSLALDTGLRANELCTLTQADTNLERCILQVVVKGGQWEAAVYSPETAAHIERWKWYRERIPGLNTLFNRIQTGKKLVPQELYKIVRSWGENIGITLGTHDLRRSMACIATTLTHTPEKTLMLGGRWSDSSMISRYTRTLRLEAMRNHLIVPKLSA